jgi:hypothetical protein
MKRITTFLTMFLLLSFSLFPASDQTAGNPMGKDNDRVVRQAFMERMPGTFDPVKYMQDQEALNVWLQSEAPPLSYRAITTIHVTEREIAEIDNYSCRKCGQLTSGAEKVRVGIVKPVGLEADFSGVTPESLSGSARFLANGMMRTVPGGVVWTAALESEKATGLRVHFSDLNLPGDAALYIYNLNGEAFGPYTGKGPDNDGDFWSHTVTGPVAFVQLRFQGPVTPEALQTTHFAIRDVGYLGEKFLLAFMQKGARLPKDVDLTDTHCSYNAWCVEDAMCYDSGDWGQIEDVRMAIAHMEWVSGPWLYYCSGGLVADTDPGSQIPYFLTANHCIDNPTDASHLQCYWQYWTAYCHAPCYNPVGAVPRTIGATLISGSSTNGDYTLLQLNESPPAGSILMGWTTQVVTYTANYQLYRISHPQGAPQAYSRHRVDPTSPTCGGWPRPQWIYSKDVIGATEPGSSGSPVFNVNGQIVGQLSGACGYNPEDPCDFANNWTCDGAFAAYFSEVEPWLDPEPQLPPDPPSNLVARTAGCTQINLTWQDNSDDEDGFEVERSLDGTNFSRIDTVPADQTTFSDTGLAQGTTYWYRVRACNAIGCSDYSNTARARTLAPPAAPQDLKAELIDEYVIGLWWTYYNLSPASISADVASNVDGFYVYRAVYDPTSISSISAKPRFVLIAELRPDARKYKDEKIEPGYIYYYKVCAFNECGETCSKIVKVAVE